MGTALQKTPLHAEHVARKGKLVEFGGWEMPLQYAEGILAEHEAVRERAGLFDVSHMGRFEISGPGRLEFSNHLITNNVVKLDPGRLLYTPICNESGGVLDDVTVYRREESILFVVNAANRSRIWDWMTRHAETWDGEKVDVVDRSGEWAQVALQGPKAQAMISAGTNTDLQKVGYYHFAETQVFGVSTLISRNGYTGEDGFELYFPSVDAARLWNAILDAGRAEGISPAGLGCRDTLRLEMAYCLYGNELSPEISPLEAGLGWTVKLKRQEPFIGQDLLKKEKAEGSKRKLIGFQMEGRRIARTGYPILVGDERVGEVTSGCFSPSLQVGIGLGLVRGEVAEVGSEVSVDVRGKTQSATVVERPFYRNGSHR